MREHRPWISETGICSPALPFNVEQLCSEKGKANQRKRLTPFCSDICNMHDTLNSLTKTNALLTRRHSTTRSIWMPFILRNSCPLSLKKYDKMNIYDGRTHSYTHRYTCHSFILKHYVMQVSQIYHIDCGRNLDIL